jgi:hypothetical protein
VYSLLSKKFSKNNLLQQGMKGSGRRVGGEWEEMGRVARVGREWERGKRVGREGEGK